MLGGLTTRPVCTPSTRYCTYVAWTEDSVTSTLNCDANHCNVLYPLHHIHILPLTNIRNSRIPTASRVSSLTIQRKMLKVHITLKTLIIKYYPPQIVATWLHVGFQQTIILYAWKLLRLSEFGQYFFHIKIFGLNHFSTIAVAALCILVCINADPKNRLANQFSIRNDVKFLNRHGPNHGTIIL